MKYEEIPELDRFIYEQICDLCTITTTVLTQKEGRHEYDTGIYVRCNCGNYLEFILPVN